ncbi:endonuclease [Rubrivivax rivuli]|uniref:Endonuclease n=1 Tax=Rubrivivax rivuli TaxID=1862385 RepID=A0A437RSZ1_9BURK|nr:endonuclease [Rubrivivax rivuli]
MLGAVAAGLLGAASSAGAFGGAGHRLIAETAEARLSPAARAEAQRLLALEPGATLASISTWADENRSLGTARWHYVNFHRGESCQYEPARLCIEGECVVGALQKQMALLAQAGTTDAERLTALKYVVHLVADVHQPLHAGFFDDRGGNSFQLQAFERGTNLHALWDTGLAVNWPGGDEAFRTAVKTAPAPAVQGTPVLWAEESCKIVAQPGFYPEERTLPASYAPRWAGTLTQRLQAASVRLAQVLNEALGAR